MVPHCVFFRRILGHRRSFDVSISRYIYGTTHALRTKLRVRVSAMRRVTIPSLRRYHPSMAYYRYGRRRRHRCRSKQNSHRTKMWCQQMWRLVSADADNSGRCAIIEVNVTVVEMSFPRARKTQQIVPPWPLRQRTPVLRTRDGIVPVVGFLGLVLSRLCSRERQPPVIVLQPLPCTGMDGTEYINGKRDQTATIPTYGNGWFVERLQLQMKPKCNNSHVRE